MRRVGAAILTVMALWSLGCGGSDSPSEPGTPPPTPDFVMTVSPTTLEVASDAPAASGAATVSALAETTLNVSVTRTGGFSGAVTVAVDGLPSGVSASSLQIGGAETSGSVTLTASAAAATGSTGLTVTGSGSGVSSKTANVTLNVSAPAPTFSLEFALPTATVVQGGTTPVTLNIDRAGGHTGEVTLTAEGAPPGLGLFFEPASTTGNTATLNLSAGAGLAPGDYVVTAAGSGGEHQAMATLTATVNEPVGSGNTTMRFCQDAGLPVWVAFQSGTGGPWLQAHESAPNEYSFDIDDDKGAVAWVLFANGAATLSVYYGSKEELNTFGSAECVTRKSLTGNFDGLSGGETGTVSLAGGVATYTSGPGSPNFTMENVAEGTRDLVASLTKLQADGQGGAEWVTTRTIIRRDTDYPAGSAIPTIDFTVEGFGPQRSNAIVTNQLGHSVSLTVLFNTANSTGAALFFNPVATTHFFGMPDQHLQSGDLHLITATATETAQSYTRTRSVTQYQRLARDLTFNLRPVMSTVTTSTIATSPYVRPRAQFAVQPEYNRFWSAAFGAAAGNTAGIFMFEGYEPGATFDRTVPDFSGVPGWSNDWGLPQGELFYSVSASGWDDGGEPGAPAGSDGTNSRVTTENGTLNP